MKTNEKTLAVLYVVLITALYVTCNTACTNSSSSSSSSSSALQEQYNADINADIDELDNLVSEIIRLEYQYMETRDESIAERGEKLCEKLRNMSYALENKLNEGKLSLEQQAIIN